MAKSNNGKCENWRKDEAQVYKNSGLCIHYGRFTGFCLRSEQEGELQPCECKGREGK